MKILYLCIGLLPSLVIFAQSPSSIDFSNPDNNTSYLRSATGKLISDIKPQDVIFWDLGNATIDSEGSIKLSLRLRTEHDFTIYRSRLKFIPAEGYIIDNITYPEATKIIDPIEKKEVEVFVGGEFELVLTRFDAYSSTNSAKESFDLKIEYVGCTRVICLFPYTLMIKVSPRAIESSGNTLATSVREAVMKEQTEVVTPIPKPSFESQLAKKLEDGGLSFRIILLIAFLGGLLTNLTPCVAPMIPITIRVLSKQSTKPFLSSAAYASGLTVTYTALGFIASWSASLFGGFIAHPIVTSFFAIFMAMFGFSMIGFGNWSKLQQVGNKIGAGQQSLRNTFLMGSGAGLVAAPCTGPILASILTYTASTTDTASSAIILAIYSLGFALPYMFLGQFVHRTTRLKVPAHVQLAVKLVFSSIMFALSFYYLRLILYSQLKFIKPYFLTLFAVSSAIGILGFLYFLSFKKFHHRKWAFVMPAIILGFGLFSGSQFLTSAEDSPLNWHFGDDAGLQSAKKENKALLIDAWAEWCEACKKMEQTTFADPAVQSYLEKHWILAKIDLTEQDEESERLQKKYEIVGLPTLILLPSNGDLSKKKNLAGFVDAGTLLQELKQFERNVK